MRLIDADAVEAKLLERAASVDISKGKFYLGLKTGFECSASWIDAIKTVEERKHGHWIEKPLAGNTTVTCSCCKTLFIKNSTKFARCPLCEAIMDGESND